MQLSRKALNARWAWTSGAAIVLLIVLNILDSILRERTGYGTVDLQFVSSGYGIRSIADRWISPPDAVLAGFTLGIDYLFMPLYGASLFFGSLVALDRFAPKPGRLRRTMTLLALAPIAAAICDVIENSLEALMLAHAATNTLASFALEATAAKFAGVLVGLVLSLAALVGRFWKRKTP